MIAYLQGQPIETDINTLTLNVRGVGYELTCSGQTLLDIEEASMVRLYVYTHVREDALQLYGFNSKLEKQLFMSLIKVNGIGPKMAIQILSTASVKELASMIDNGEVKKLMALPKVGKKTAEQIILSLKGKLVQEAISPTPAAPPVHAEITSALVNLGFRLPDVELVVKNMPEAVDFQEGVREGLSQLTNQF